MKNIFFLLVSILLILSFSIGIYVEYEKLVSNSLKILFNFDQFDNSKEFSKSFYLENDFSSLIHVKSINDISKLRSDLIEYIWKEPTINYSKLPTNFEKNIFDNNYDDLENLKQIDKFTILMEFGVNSTSYLFLPQNSNNELIVYHQGHRGDFNYGKNTIGFFLKNGYSVLAFSMPLLGMNNQPVIDTEFGKIHLISHNYFKFLDSKDFSSLKFYFEPIVLSLNYIEKNYDFNNFYMIGISGGGWTSTIYSAIDERISQSFSVAGSIPISLRINENDFGDYEQTLVDFYQIGNYLDLYLLASFGENRKHIQIFNKNDPCCFAGDPRGIYDTKIKSILQELGKGNFEIYLDDTHFEHKISDYSLNIIESEINKTQ